MLEQHFDEQSRSHVCAPTGSFDRHYLMVHGRIIESLSNADALAPEGDLFAHLGV